MKVVRFLKPHTPYAAGDVAGVDDELAKQLVADEICEPVKAGSEKRQDAEVQLPRLNVKDMQPQRDKMVKEPAVKK